MASLWLSAPAASQPPRWGYAASTALQQTNIRSWIVDAIPVSIKNAIGVGTGLFVALIRIFISAFAGVTMGITVWYGFVSMPPSAGYIRGTNVKNGAMISRANSVYS